MGPGKLWAVITRSHRGSSLGTCVLAGIYRLFLWLSGLVTKDLSLGRGRPFFSWPYGLALETCVLDGFKFEGCEGVGRPYPLVSGLLTSHKGLVYVTHDTWLLFTWPVTNSGRASLTHDPLIFKVKVEFIPACISMTARSWDQ